MNFKYGYSQYPDRTQLAREVRERDYFFIASFAIWGLWVAMGLATLMEWVNHALADREPDPARRWLFATPVLLLALVPLIGNRLTASRAGETLARDFAVDMLQSVEPYGVLVTAGDNDTFPLWYAQEVEGVRKDVTVLNLSLGNTVGTSAYAAPPIYPFDTANSLALYKDAPGRSPPVLSYMSDAQLARSTVLLLDQKTSVQLVPITTTLDPGLIGRQYLERADIVVLQAIKNNQGKRPIYFSRTVGMYADQFGLTAYVEGQGFARKLHYRQITPSDSIQAIGQLGYANVPRSTALMFGVYHASTAARQRPRGWVDRPSKAYSRCTGCCISLVASAQGDEPTLSTRRSRSRTRSLRTRVRGE